MSPCARSLKLLRGLGFLAAPVERWIPRIERHVDLFGIGDVLAVHPRERTVLLVQATSAAHVGDRLKRVQARPETRQLLQAGLGIEVWGWRFDAGRWYVRRVAVRAEDLAGIEVQALPSRRGKPRRMTHQPDLFE